MRTLVVHVGAVGDFVLTLPALELLARDGPLELAGYRERLELAVAGGVAVAAHNTGSFEFSSVFSSPHPRLLAFLARFDRAVVWMKDDGVIESVFRSAGVVDVRCFPGLPPQGWAGHAADYYMHCVGGEGFAQPGLLLGDFTVRNEAVIHPGSGSAKKNWAFSNFEELANRLRADGLKVRWCLGPAEEHFSPPAQDDVLRGLSLTELARELAQARVFLGNDSGIAHISAALGRFSVVVFGPSDPFLWGPRGIQVRIMRGEPWPLVEEVWESLRGFLVD